MRNNSVDMNELLGKYEQQVAKLITENLIQQLQLEKYEQMLDEYSMLNPDDD